MNNQSWLPEDARLLTSLAERAHSNYVGYVAPDGSLREYIAGDREITFYKRAFRD